MDKTKVFVVKILIENTDLNSYSVEVFNSYEKAKEFADSEISIYVDDYDSDVNLTEDYPHKLQMQIQGDTYITIEIIETEIK